MYFNILSTGAQSCVCVCKLITKSNFRVLELEKKKESAHINSRTRELQNIRMEQGPDEGDDDDDDDDDDEIDEYLDWRAKKAHKWIVSRNFGTINGYEIKHSDFA